jgi:3-phenylpropionate/cinnamic acid dioxygenase small subunit
MMSPEHFLYRSFRILDEGNYSGWLALCAKDINYTVTTAENVSRNYVVSIINDNYDRLQGRITSMEEYWHAEKPPTRTLHMITNVECDPIEGDKSRADELSVHSCFMVTATRRERQVMLTGRYRDTLRAAGDSWLLASRLAVLDKSLLDGGKVTFIL